MSQQIFRLAMLTVLMMASQSLWHRKTIAQTQTLSTTNPRNPIDSIDIRFSNTTVDESPHFQKHIIPLLGKLGCNGRACHGSFQGRGGFQLSLFGYDFASDHSAMLDPDAGRIDLDDVDESLILAKPLDSNTHEGGQRFQAGSWQHNVLKTWITNGAIYDSTQPKILAKLDVQPAEIDFAKSDENASLRVVAHWQDGTAEDVTILCRFQSNDDSIATVSKEGSVVAHQSGDTHIVVSYDNAVIPVPVILPFRSETQIRPTTSNHPVDQLVDQKLRKLNIQASNLCSDAEFIRRVSLDITGILPSADQVKVFLSNTNSRKRENLIDELLNSDGYAAWWATRFSDWTGNSDEQLTNVLPIRNAATRLWYEWLRNRISQNVPYDNIVEGIVAAQSRNHDESYAEYCEEMTQACQPGQESRFASREGMPLYWARRNFQTPEDRAIGFSYTFLGVRIECAQCHKHPFDKWSKNDFEQFAKLFSPIRVNQNQVAADASLERKRLISELTGNKKLRGNELRKVLYDAAKQKKTIPFGELLVNVRTLTEKQKRAIEAAKNSGRQVKAPTIPSGKILGVASEIKLDHDPRTELMQWLRDSQNPYFSKAIVNRVWSNYFGIGIVNPTDDMNLANPPSNGPLMEYLANGFIKNKFDLKWLHRTITTSDTYQRSVHTNASNVIDHKNFARHVPRRLPAEVIFDAITLVTSSDEQATKIRNEVSTMAIADGKPKRRNQQEFALEVFGQSNRESNCDCDRSDSPSLLQSVYLRNDADIHERLTDNQGWVTQVCKEIGIEPPARSNDIRKQSEYKRADSIRKQVLTQLERFHQSTGAQQERMRKQFETGFNRTAERIEALGYQMPPLSELLENPSTWPTLVQTLPKVANPNDIRLLVNQGYLRTLSRYPDDHEERAAIEYIHDSETTSEGVTSLIWVLMNTKEFIVTH